MALIKINAKKDLINLKKKIKENLLNEYIGDQNIQQDVEKFYKPLITPLEKIAKPKKSAIESGTDSIPAIESGIDSIPAIESGIDSIPAIESDTDSIPAIESTPHDVLNLGKVADKYLKSGFKKDYDYAYGIRPIDGSSKFKLGSHDVKIDGDDLEIEGEKYTGTPGLWELLTQKEPKDYTREDHKKYNEIMMTTKPFLNENGLIKPSRGVKYKNFIGPLYKKYNQKRAAEKVDNIRTRSYATGSGIEVVFLPSDSNELIERHRLLFGSLSAGNNGVYNEFQACTNELLKRGFLNVEDVMKIM